MIIRDLFETFSRRAIVVAQNLLKNFPKNDVSKRRSIEASARLSTITRKLHADLSPIQSNVILRKLENDLDRERAALAI